MAEAEATDSREPSLRDVRGFLQRHFLALGLSAFLGLALAVAYLHVRSPSYRAEATLYLQQQGSGGILGDLAMLASLSGATASTGELAYLASRTLAEKVLEPPAGLEPARPGVPGYSKHMGLVTTTRDASLSALELTLDGYLGTRSFTRPSTHPPARLHASVERSEDNSPRRVEVTFLEGGRVRIETPSRLASLGLADSFPAEADFSPAEPVMYRGLTLRLVPEGEFAGRSFYVEHHPVFDAVVKLMQRIDISEEGRSSGVMTVAVSDADPHRAAETANAICENYLEWNEVRAQARAMPTIQSIQGMIEEQQARFDRAQAKLFEMQAERPELLDLASAARATIEQLVELEFSKVEIELRRLSLAEVVSSLGAGDAFALARLDSAIATGLVVDPITQGYLEQIAELSGLRSTRGALLTDENPEIVGYQEAIHELEGKILQQLGGRVEGLRAQSATVGQQISAFRAGLGELPEGQEDFALAQLEVEAHAEILPYLLRALQGAEITRAASGYSVDYIDRAVPPNVFETPSVPTTLLAGLLLAVVGTTLLLMAREATRSIALDEARIEVLTDLPVLASLPSFGRGLRASKAKAGAGFLAVRDEPVGEYAQAVRQLRAALASPSGSAPRVIGVTSALAGGGGSGVAASLAYSLALGGARALLIDADLSSPSLHRTWGEALSPGLAENIGSEQNQEGSLRSLDGGLLHLLPAGEADVPAGDLLVRGTAREAIGRAGEGFEVVVLDLGSTLERPDAQVLAATVDGVVLVGDRSESGVSALRHACRRLGRTGARLLGLVLNPRVT